MRRNLLLALVLIVANSFVALAAEEPAVRQGEVRFEPAADEQTLVPAPFRMETQTFSFEQRPAGNVDPAVTMSVVTFPSPVKTPYANNNTVYCEYYRPTAPGKHPACVVLHFLGNNFVLPRMFASHLAHQGVAALFVEMPYYGERRPADANVRMISLDPQQTVAGMTQAVKDVRFAGAWLRAQDEVDPQQLGIFGISLGGITASLTAAAEPRFSKVCPLLAGGDLCAVMRDSQERHFVAARERWAADGKPLDGVLELIKTVDPCTYQLAREGRKVLMLNASNDEVIPRACTDKLWESFGRPPIVWYDCGHYSAALHVLDALAQVGAFFQSSN